MKISNKWLDYYYFILFYFFLPITEEHSWPIAWKEEK